MGEIWKPVVGYEGMYEVSNMGRIKSLMRRINANGGIRVIQEFIKKNSIDSKGYEYVWLWNKTGRTYRIHKLVCMAFIPNPGNKPCIDHINGNRRDNRVENLRWCTHKENSNFDIANERMKKNAPWKGKHGAGVPWSKPVLQYDFNGKLIGEYGGALEAARIMGVSHSCISDACRGKQKTACGYIWKYKQE